MLNIFKKTPLFTLLLLPTFILTNTHARSYGTYNSYTAVEFNPIRFIIPEPNVKSISMAYSMFSPSNNTELRFPINFVQEKYEDDYGISYQNSLFTVDAEYRYFLNNKRINGLFVGAHARGAILSEDRDNKYSTKLGAGVSLGYRYMPKNSHLTFGMSIKATTYILGDNEIFGGNKVHYLKAMSDDASTSINYEFFNIGYKF